MIGDDERAAGQQVVPRQVDPECAKAAAELRLAVHAGDVEAVRRLPPAIPSSRRPGCSGYRHSLVRVFKHLLEPGEVGRYGSGVSPEVLVAHTGGIAAA